MSSRKKIYTRTGDKGKTSLYGGERILKNHLKLNAYGSIDEVNSFLGIVLSKLDDERVEDFINQIQKDLFRIGSYLAEANVDLKVLKHRVKEMEDVIDSLLEKMPPLNNFILPEGTEGATFLYFTRAVARRAERELVALSREEKINEKVLIYLNRLSDFLFVIARYLNFKSGIVESVWKESENTK